MSGRKFKAKENHRREIMERVEAAKRDGVGSPSYMLAVATPECIDAIRSQAEHYLDCVVDPLRDDLPHVHMLALAEHVEFWAPVFGNKERARLGEALRTKKWLKNISEAMVTDGVRLVDLSWWPHK